jgi:general secretion pathway protein G
MTMTKRKAVGLSSNSRGFTLLEMLVVLVIIGLLAGLVGPRLFSKVDQSKLTTAAIQVKLLRGAVENVRLDIGRYPSAEEGLSLLVKPPADQAVAARWRGPYLDDAVPLDPWNNPYQYGLRGQDGNSFALYSFGADGQRGGEGDAKDIGVLPAP